MSRTPSRPRRVLTAEKIVLRYPGGADVLNGASLSAESGHVTMLVGRSGSGKTSLLRVLQGLMRPQGGRVVRDPADLVCAYIPQGLGLVRNATTLQNVLNGLLRRAGWAATWTGRFPDALIREAEEALDRVGLSHKIRDLAGCLSGGERQRVAIARCLVRKPDFVLADEFVSQLDAVTALEMDGLVRKSVASGTGWIITTHHLDVACRAGDRVVALKNGRIALDKACCDASPAALEEAIR